MPSREERDQQWRFIGAIGVLGAIGLIGLLVGYGFSDHANDVQNKSLHMKLDKQAGEILDNRARINQLEEGYTSRGIQIPAVPTTTVVHRPPVTTRSTTTTTAPPTTTTTAKPRRGTCLAEICIGGSP